MDMDKDTAREVIRAVYRSGNELEALIPFLKDHCSASEYKDYLHAIAVALDGIHTGLVGKVVARFPELEAEIEANIQRTGRAMP